MSPAIYERRQRLMRTLVRCHLERAHASLLGNAIAEERRLLLERPSAAVSLGGERTVDQIAAKLFQRLLGPRQSTVHSTAGAASATQTH